jgi:ribosome-associated toxin RatA of RatAB toxin-antitoxin module
MEKLEQVVKSFFRYLYPFITDLKISMDEESYLMTIFVDFKRLQRYFQFNPTYISGSGKLNKQYTERPFNNFISIADERVPTSQNQAKNLEQNLKKDFYMARKMVGSSFPAKVLRLGIVLQ